MPLQGEEQLSPFLKPGFLVATVIVVAVVIAGVVLAVVNVGDDEPTSDPSPPSSLAATQVPAAVPTAEEKDLPAQSVCGLDGAVTHSARLTKPPAVDEWRYQGTTAYPVSAEFGPGDTSRDGVRHCYQHSPEGAVVAAANALVMSNYPETLTPWVEYMMTDAAAGQSVVQDFRSNIGDVSPTRGEIKGFRLLEYTGELARVDIGAEATSGDSRVSVSMVFELTWENGDWHLIPQQGQPARGEGVPDLTGYISWSPAQ